MKTLKSRILSGVMAGVLAVSMAIPAFATSTPAPVNMSTNITGSYEEIPIEVTVPQTGTAQINPYGLPVSIPVGEKTVDLVGQQITTKPLSIKNQGTVKLDVNATLAVVPSGDVAIVTSVGSSEKGKEIAVNLEVAALDDATLAVASDSEKLEEMLTTKFAADATWENAEVLAAPAAAKGDTAADIDPAASGSAMAVLGAVTTKAEGFTYAKNSIALFRLTGDMNEEPEKTENGKQVADPWVAADGFTANIVFKFKPHADVAASISLDNGTLTLANGATDSLAATFNAGDSGLTVTSWAWSTSSAVVADVSRNDSPNATVEWKGSGSATITVTATLSDTSTVTATCAVTCNA